MCRLRVSVPLLLELQPFLQASYWQPRTKEQTFLNMSGLVGRACISKWVIKE
jgi:hypothetical protein